MNDEIKNKIAQIVFEAAKNLNIKDIYAKPKDNREVIKVSEVKITPEMEIEPEYLEVSIPKAEKHKKDFLRILLKTEFEDNAEHLYQSLCRIKLANIEILSESIRKDNLNRCQDELNIAQLLFLLKTDTQKVFLKNSRLECELPNSIIKEIENKTENRYISMGLNLVPMTYEEAEDELSTAFAFPEYDYSDEGATGATKWLCEYLNLTLDEFLYYCRDDSPTDDMIKAYSEENFVPCEEITLSQIESTINELQAGIRKYSRKGRPQKNERIYAALSVFVDCGFQATNKQFKTIYECLDYFGFIDDNIKKGWNKCQKYPEIQYMKSIYRQSQKFKVIFKHKENPLPF